MSLLRMHVGLTLHRGFEPLCFATTASNSRMVSVAAYPVGTSFNSRELHQSALRGVMKSAKKTPLY